MTQSEWALQSGRASDLAALLTWASIARLGSLRAGLRWGGSTGSCEEES